MNSFTRLASQLLSRCSAASRKLILAVYDLVLFYTALLLLALTSIVWSGCAIVLEQVLPRETGRRLGRSMITILFRAFFALLQRSGRFSFDFSALDVLRQEKSLIIAANHPALWDAVMIVSRLPNAVCVMKDALVGNIFLGRGASLAGYICNESARKVIVQAVAELRQGCHVVLFPEGTRTTVLPVNEFKGGIGIIARQADAPVQTVLIETDTPFLGKGWAMLKKPPLPIRCTLRLGRRFTPGDSASRFSADLHQYFSAELVSRTDGSQPSSRMARSCALLNTGVQPGLLAGMQDHLASTTLPAPSQAPAMLTSPTPTTPDERDLSLFNVYR